MASERAWQSAADFRVEASLLHLRQAPSLAVTEEAEMNRLFDG